MLSDLTLIVPTYNRPEHIMRQMKYWRRYPVSVHVLDGSGISLYTKGIGDNVHYHHWPVSTQERLGKVIDLIDTKYCMFMCDDEFYIPSALEHCIETLEAENELVSCIGRCLGFYHTKKGIVARPMYTRLKGHRVDGWNSRERMLSQMNPYVQSTFFSVMRSDVWKRSMGVVAEKTHTVKLPYASEIQFELATCYQGKSKVIEDLMWLRNMYTKPVDFSGHSRKLQFDEWIRDSRYGSEVDFFYVNTADVLAGFDGADRYQVRMDFKEAVDAYLRYCKDRGFMRRLYDTKNQMMNSIPGSLRDWLQSVRISNGCRPLLEEARIMQKDHVVVDMKELRSIVELCMNSL